MKQISRWPVVQQIAPWIAGVITVFFGIFLVGLAVTHQTMLGSRNRRCCRTYRRLYRLQVVSEVRQGKFAELIDSQFIPASTRGATADPSASVGMTSCSK